MKTFIKFWIVLFLIGITGVSCRHVKDEKKNETSVESEPVPSKSAEEKTDEFAVLYDYLKQNGDFINSPYCPAMIDAKEVHQNMNRKDFLIIDLRKPEHYRQGHIPHAENVPYFKVISYVENQIRPQDYEKIVLVCYSGQSASYLTSLLNMAGYDNVYAMKFGMSSWNKATAKDYWLKNISDKYADRLETKENPKNEPGVYPSLYTGEKEGSKIFRKRLESVMMDPFKARLVSADEVFAHPERYYIVNYWPREKYLAGHIPGAIQYTPKKDLKKETYLNTLPVDKPIVIYCYTGQHASMLAAYLNLLGYDARVLKYGANSFMHSILKKNRWHAFTPKKIYGFPLVKQEEPAAVSY